MTSSIQFSITAWRAWAPGFASLDDWQQWPVANPAAEPKPDLGPIPTLLKRRLNPLGRMLASVLWPLLDTRAPMPWIIASRHGEVQRSANLLVQLLDQQPLSPTEFALSVHNASAGILSIARQQRVPISALAAGPETLTAGLIDACGLLADGQPQVLLAIADDVLPNLYLPNAADVSLPYACALILEAGSDWQLSRTTAVASEPGAAFAALLAKPNGCTLPGGWRLDALV